MKYEKLLQKIEHFNVKKGLYCLNKNEVLFKVNIIKIGNNKFAIMVSISHILADGYTFYTIYNMLSMDSEPRALEAERFHDFS